MNITNTDGEPVTWEYFAETDQLSWATNKYLATQAEKDWLAINGISIDDVICGNVSVSLSSNLYTLLETWNLRAGEKVFMPEAYAL